MKKVRRYQKYLCIAITMFMFTFHSCVNYNKVDLFQEKTVKDLSQEFTTQRGAAYRVKSGDHLYIKIYSVDPKTSKFFQTDFPQFMSSTYLYLNSYRVDEEGYLSFSFVEKMYVKGLTVNEIKDLIQNTLDQYFKETTVLVKLVNFQVTVLGEVGSPGTFDIYKEEINIYEAIGRAGGFKEFANADKIKLVRQTPNGSKIYVLDLTDNGVLQSEFMFLKPNDIIYVDPRKTKAFAFRSFPYGFVMGLGTTALSLLILFDVIEK